MKKKIKPSEKMYVIRKYIMAQSASEALRKDKTTPVDDVWIDSDWKEGKNRDLSSAIGFDTGHYPD